MSLQLDPLVLDTYDAIHFNTPQSASKVEVRFTRFALYLGCQRHPSKAQTQHYSFSSIKDYVLGARRQLSILLNINFACLA